ncbi:MAG: TAT-variant-translocated molybdopterin oxidoreductase [Rubripirellula sp.]
MTSNESASSTIEALDASRGESPAQGERKKPSYWRSLSEFRGQEDFNEYLDREFPVAASEFPEGVSRRRWMQLMGASLAVVGAAGCRYPVETIEPFVIRPEGRVPGESYQRATNFELAGRVYNLLVGCVDGRPLKIEPNREHPSGVGTDVYSQASILGLYDPDRSRGDEGFLIRKLSSDKRRFEVSWDDFDAAAMLKTVEGNNGGGAFAVLMSPTSSPSLARMIKSLKERCPKAVICQYDGVTGDSMVQATEEVLGTSAKQMLDLEQAEVIVTLQADILGSDRGMVSNAVGFANRRDPMDGEMNRLYVVEGGYTSTGAAADSRLALRPGQMKAFLAELGRRVEKLAGGEKHDHSDELKAYDELDSDERLERFLDVLAHDVAEAGDKAVVVVGEHLGAEAIAAGIRMNKTLGSYGKLQKFIPRVDAGLSTGVGLGELVERIGSGDIDSLLILGDNPVVTAPGDVDLASAIGKLERSVYLGEYDDETGSICQWSLPMAHPLESWGDCVNDHGHYGVCQPQILPLLGGRASVELLAEMLGERDTDGGRIVRRTADEVGGGSLSDRQWRQLLHDGFAEDLAVDSEELSVGGEAKELTSDAPVADSKVDKNAIEVIFMPADGLYDGRFANNGWLQEMPQSLTKLSWDNAAVMSPATARGLSTDGDATESSEGPAGRVLKHGQMVALRIGDSKVELPVYEMPGCAPGVITVTIGYGRERVGMVGGDPSQDVPVVGRDVSPIRMGDDLMIAYDVEGRPRYQDYELATTQDHWAIDERGRDETETRSFTLVREGTTELLKKVPKFAESKGPHVPHVGADGSPWTEPITEIEERNKAEGKDVPQWGMSVDLSKCIGCNACVVACQSENNVPIVGREQILNSREMHWLRLDRYFQGDEENADIVQEPVACMHCETAPCEQVCPVAATVHTEEGINAMAYNRCIGTRYCANNCPFKVRRFNYFNYNEDIGTGYGIDAYPSHIENANRKLQALVMNPEVTVRGRGVMEKCTYCIQRVEKAKITARKEDRRIADGDVVTACQSACPTRAIEFGSIADPESVVSQKREDPRSYGMLSQLNVKPRTEYLARVRNPHRRLMTTQQLSDLENLKAPHKADHGHGAEEHGDHAHGDEGDHGHDDHSAADHSAADHSGAEHKSEAATAGEKKE